MPKGLEVVQDSLPFVGEGLRVLLNARSRSSRPTMTPCSVSQQPSSLPCAVPDVV